jgi:hypothetical protein
MAADDRPRLDEIEVTPEMVEAGASVLCGFHTFFADEASWAEDVYRAMEQTRREKAADVVGDKQAVGS